MAKIGLVTVLFKSEDVLEGFFKSLSMQSFKDYILYIVDNTPSEQTDTLIARLSAMYPVSTIKHFKFNNIGVAAGNNVGIKEALQDQCDYTLLLNNDIEFYQEDLLSGLLAKAENGEELIIPKIYYFDTKKVWMAGAHYFKYKALTRHIGELKDDNPIYDREAYCNYAPTCFMLIKSSVFNSVGIMDEKYFVYYDDTDFIYRATQKGYKIFYYPHYKVYHKVSSSTGGWETPFTIYYGNRNRLYFINKNLKSIEKISAYFYFFATRIPKFLTNNKAQNKSLWKGIKEGLSYK